MADKEQRTESDTSTGAESELGQLKDIQVKDISSRPQNQKPSLREQLDLLSNFVNAGASWAINPVTFPDIPADRLYAEAVQAYDNNNGRIQWARFLIQDPEAFRKLEINTTQIIQESEGMLRGLADIEGEVDHQLLRHQMVVRQNGDANRSMDEVINRGLVEDLTERNFPAIRGMEPVSRYMLLMNAVSHRIKILQDQRDLSLEGFTQSKREQDSPKNINSKEIEYWKKVQAELITKYAVARAQSNWQIPDFE